MEVPVTDKRYEIRDLINKAFPGEQDILMGENDTIADTVFLFKKDSIYYEISRPLITTDTSCMEEKVGVRTLKNTPEVDILFEFPGVSGLSGTVIVPSPVTFTQSQNRNLSGIKSVTIDQNSPPLNISVQNTSQDADIEKVTVTMLDKGNEIGSIKLKNLSAKSAVVAPFEIQGKSIHNPLTVKITATIPTGAQLCASEGLQVKFNLDNIMVSEAVILDSLIDYTETFSGALGLLENFKLGFFDIDQASVSCEIENPCAFKMKLSGRIEHAWDRDFARKNNLRSISQLHVIKDSSAFAGEVICDTAFKLPEVPYFRTSISLKNIRIFPTWDSDSAKSILKFHYLLNSISDGRWVRFNKNDLISFKLITSRFQFIQISGEFTEPLIDTFSSEEKIGFDWNSAILDSLRKSFRFESVQMNFRFTTELPPGSFLDSMHLNLELAKKNKKDGSILLNKKFAGICPDSQHTADMQLASLINIWPDTLAFNTKIVLPAGNRLEFVNRKSKEGKYSSDYSIGINVHWNLKIALAWKILDTIRTELEPSSFSFKEDLQWIERITQPEITLNVNALNNTNLQFTLFALWTSDKFKQKLISVPDSFFYSNGTDVDTSPVFRLFGLRGLNLPPRGKVDSLKVKLDHRAVGALISHNDCHIRWLLVIPASGSDVLSDSDFLDIKATAVIEGICNSDSLLY